MSIMFDISRLSIKTIISGVFHRKPTLYILIGKEFSRETFRKQAMHHFRNAALTEDNGKATNSPNYRYRITEETLNLIQSYGSGDWVGKLADFKVNHESLVDLYASKKKMTKMPVKINGSDFTFSPGAHNALQKAIIEEFAPRFAPNSECLYVGDTIEKDLVKNVDKLAELGFEITLHDKKKILLKKFQTHIQRTSNL